MEPGILKSESQTLITGVYRTGTEFVTQLINSHPHISATMYRVNVLRFIYGKYDPISKKDNQNRALKDLEQRLWDRYKLSINTDQVLKALTEYRHVDYGIFYDAVMSTLYLKDSCMHWAEKNQLLWREIPKFLQIMPNGKAILVLRDPRSVLGSFKKYTYADPPAYLGAIFNCYDAMKHAKQYSGQYREDQFLIIRYEDIAREPRAYMEKLWAFLELEPIYKWNQQEWRDAYGQDWHANSSFHDNTDRSPFDVDRAINRWHEELNPDEVFLAEGICRELMDEYGYHLSNPNSDWIRAIRLFAYDDKITNHFRKWLIKGEGIEAFPTDPLDPENWERPKVRS